MHHSCQARKVDIKSNLTWSEDDCRYVHWREWISMSAEFIFECKRMRSRCNHFIFNRLTKLRIVTITYCITVGTYLRLQSCEYNVGCINKAAILTNLFVIEIWFGLIINAYFRKSRSKKTCWEVERMTNEWDIGAPFNMRQHTIRNVIWYIRKSCGPENYWKYFLGWTAEYTVIANQYTVYINRLSWTTRSKFIHSQSFCSTKLIGIVYSE